MKTERKKERETKDGERERENWQKMRPEIWLHKENGFKRNPSILNSLVSLQLKWPLSVVFQRRKEQDLFVSLSLFLLIYSNWLGRAQHPNSRDFTQQNEALWNSLAEGNHWNQALRNPWNLCPRPPGQKPESATASLLSFLRGYLEVCQTRREEVPVPVVSLDNKGQYLLCVLTGPKPGHWSDFSTSFHFVHFCHMFLTRHKVSVTFFVRGRWLVYLQWNHPPHLDGHSCGRNTSNRFLSPV